MDDLISRQAAIDAIRASTSKYTGFMEMEMYTDDDAVEAIEGLPPAQPEITEEAVKEYCRKRCLTIVTNDYFHKLASAQPVFRQCKDCKFSDEFEGDVWLCRRRKKSFRVLKTDTCNVAERRQDG